MAKLTDTHLIILSAASARDDGIAAVPPKMNKAAASKVGASLVARKLMREARSKPGLPIWRLFSGRDGAALVADRLITADTARAATAALSAARWSTRGVIQPALTSTAATSLDSLFCFRPVCSESDWRGQLTGYAKDMQRLDPTSSLWSCGGDEDDSNSSLGVGWCRLASSKPSPSIDCGRGRATGAPIRASKFGKSPKAFADSVSPTRC
jgi:hypothetical protein